MKKVLKNISKISFILIISLIFVDIVNAETYNNYTDSLKSCGNGLLTEIPAILPKVISIIYIIIQIAVPVVLVIMGSIDLMKSITAGKEDEIAKGRQTFIKRLVAAVLVFFAFIIVKLVIGLVADSDSKIMDCTNCFIRNECRDSFLGNHHDSFEDIWNK